MTIYVDDTLVCGKIERVCKFILDLILKDFKGKHEPPKRTIDFWALRQDHSRVKNL